tara:strand:+ start:14301 stop:16643 length:2343 start_codon:yes stop_codon:yes gene_type:complete
MAEDNKKEDNLTGLDQFSLDKIAGVKMGGIKPKAIDTTGIDEQIAALEKPASGNVYDKMAARYRSQGEAAVLRTQKNLANLFGPTITLIQEREAAAQNRFTLLKDKLPEFDDSTIFGHQSGNPMPIVDEIKRISQATKEDMRMLSRLNINDERYDEIKKRIEKNQDAIVAFDAINEKLLEIRNSQDGREDESQWSRGMDATTRRMWEDIYSSSGQNIKIQNGKLVWTDTKGTTSYEFEGGSYQDDKYEALGGYDTTLGKLTFMTRDNDGNQHTFKKGQKVYGENYDITGVQEALIEGGFTDANGNELDPDGEWGPKSQAAYDKYLKNKDKLEKEWLDENYEGDLRKTTGIGETKVIDLNEIGDGPTTIDNLGIKKDIEVQSAIQELINKNITVNTPGYESQVSALIRTINSVGPKGIKSLIFDGFGAEQGDVLKSTNTDSFIEQIIQNNPEEFGIKDVENLTEEEIANAYDIMRSRDVTYSYSNELGESKTLQSQYLQWYRKQIDTKVQEGVKTNRKISSKKTTGKATNFKSWKNFKKGFSSISKENIQSSGYQIPNISDGENTYSPVLKLNEDGKSYDIIFDEDNALNQTGLSVKEAASQLKELLTITGVIKKGQDISIDAIEDMLVGNVGEVPEDIDFERKVEIAQQPYIEKMKKGANVNYIVDNIWQPNTPEGYNMGENGKALFDYLADNGFGSKGKSLYDLGETNWKGKAFIEFPKAGTKGMTMLYGGEKIWIYERDMAGNSKLVDSWTGDSTGGRSYDKEDIEEILNTLGITAIL